MLRVFAMTALLAVAGCATEPTEPAVAADAGPPASYPDKAYELTCGTERVDVHFTPPEAHVTLDGTFYAVPRLDGGGATYTNGRITIWRSGSGDTIAFARGRMAAQPCVTRPRNQT